MMCLDAIWLRPYGPMKVIETDQEGRLIAEDTKVALQRRTQG